MTCANCDQTLRYPGKIIKVDNNKCAVCGDPLQEVMTTSWDSYFHNICEAVASKSPCLSRQIGAILVRDKSIISTGYNGPPRGYPHCGEVPPRTMTGISASDFQICPRRLKGYASGEGLDECPAAHAEANCIANAARIGASTVGSTLYMNCIIPCKDCSALLINAGIVEVVVDSIQAYHALGVSMLRETNMKVRTFKSEVQNV